MKVIIVEPAYHFEVVSTYLRMFLPYVDSIEVFSSTHVIKNLSAYAQESKIKLTPNDPNKNFASFINDSVAEASSHAEITIFTSNEANDGSLIWNDRLKNPFLLVHNPSYTLRPFSIKLLIAEPWRSPLLIIKMVKTFFSKNKVNRRKNFDLFHNILLPDEGVVNFCRSNFPKDFKNKNTISAPFFSIEKISALSENHKLSIVIPGTIDDKTRDYRYIIDLFKEIRGNVELDLVLLGKVRKKSWISIIAKALPTNIHLKWKAEGYSQSEYDCKLENASFAILPLKKYMRQACTYEIQGKTCISGSINDVVRFGIPFLYPADVTIPQPLNKVGIPFDKNFDINSMFKDVNGRAKYLEIKEKYFELQPHLGYETLGKLILRKMQEKIV